MTIAPTPESQPASVRARVEALERECGCQAGALTGLAALVAYLASLLVTGPWFGGPVLAGLTGFAVFASAVALGKHTALARARRERQRLLEALGDDA